MMEIKNEILYRIYFLLFGIFIPISVIMVYRTIVISIVQGEEWRQQGKDNYVRYKEIEAERGNILAMDGSVLSTSIPYFDLYFDPVAPQAEDFNEHIDSLSFCLASYVDDTYTPGGLRDYLIRARADSSNRHILIKKGATFIEKGRIEQYPLFSKGRFRGGLIVEQRNERRRPFGLLAQRTIGYVRESAKPVGIEGAMDSILSGEPGGQMMIRVDAKKDIWLPLEDLTAMDPKSGDDVVTTIDVNIQDIAENALLRGMNAHDAEWGTAVVMDVKTGAVRAIANLGRGETGWWESFNYAIGSSVEPGSTFKTATMLALLEDGVIKLEDSIDIHHGKAQFFEQLMVDSSPESNGLDTISIQRAFEISSNVGVAGLAQRYYGAGNGPDRFIRRLKQFNLHLPSGIEIEGEANPYLKEAFSETWSGISLPWIAHGYEMRITPLQLLSFYNSIANNGVMMKPYLVSATQHYGEVLDEFSPVIVKKRIASERSIQRIRQLLEGVVNDGTARKLHTDAYNFAGKTGTAQINYKRSGKNIKIGGYRASFVGYFPAEKPRYSCIVVIHRPRKAGFYGSDVAGPIFREISDKIMASGSNHQTPMNLAVRPVMKNEELPGLDAGASEDLRSAMKYLDLPFYGRPGTEMAVMRTHADSILFQNRTIAERSVPNVLGMTLRDALYSLENAGLKVRLNGVGKVISQSVPPNSKVRGQTISITLR
jgi:cell division protein FtsI (penicillin-binding protein 3)